MNWPQKANNFQILLSLMVIYFKKLHEIKHLFIKKDLAPHT